MSSGAHCLNCRGLLTKSSIIFCGDPSSPGQYLQNRVVISLTVTGAFAGSCNTPLLHDSTSVELQTGSLDSSSSGSSAWGIFTATDCRTLAVRFARSEGPMFLAGSSLLSRL